YARIVVQSDRSVNLGNLAVPTAETVTEVSTAPRPPISIGRVAVKNSRVRFADFSLSPRFLSDIEQLAGTIEGLSSQADSQARVELAGSVDAYAPVTIRGRINPLAEQITLDLGLVFRNVELSSLTPYSGKFAGYTIEKGKLDLDLGYTVEKRELKGENKV